MPLPVSFFRKDALALLPGPTGLDVVRLRQRGSAIRVLESFRIPASPETGEDPSARLEAELETRGWNALPCVLGIPSSLLSIRDLHWSGPAGEKDVRRRTRVQTDEFESLSGARALGEYSLSTLGSTRCLVLYIAREDTIHHEIRRFRAAGARVADAAPLSLAFYMGTREEASISADPRVVVYVGADKTDGMVGNASGILLSRTLRTGAPLPNGETAASLEAWRRSLSEFRGEILAMPELRSAAERPWILGGVRIPDDKCLADLRETPGVDIHATPPDRLASVTARGLLAATSRIPASRRVSLLPADQRVPALKRAASRYRKAACLVFLAALAVFVLHLRQQTGWLERQWAEKTRTVHERETAREELNELRRTHQHVETSLQHLQHYMAGQTGLGLLFQAVAETRDPRDWLVLAADAESYFAGERMASRYGESSSPYRRYILEGYTSEVDLSTVRRMIEQLNRRDFIQKVDLLPDDQIRTRPRLGEQENEGIRRFALEIFLRGREA